MQLQLMVTCKHCGYTWNYKGRNTYANCPQCSYKVFGLKNGDNNVDNNALNVGLTKLKLRFQTSSDRIRLVPWGDVHVGAPEGQCDWSKAKAELEYVLNREDTYLIGMGDYMDCAQKMPWKKGPNVYMESMPPSQQYKIILEALKPLAAKGKIIGLHYGNHEQWVMDIVGFNPVETLCSQLGVPMLGPACETTIQVNQQKYVVYSMHGGSSARLKHTKLGALIAQVKDIVADLYLYGHTHQIASSKGGKRFMGRQMKVYYVLTGHFLDWEGSYAQLFGLEICPSGCPQIKLFADRRDIHVSI